MKENFVVKKAKENQYYFLILFLFGTVLQSHVQGYHVALLPLMLLLIIAVLLYTIMYFRWMASFAVFVDMNKQEIILNHSLAFRKKKIAFKDVKEVDTEKGNIILFGSIALSKWQRFVSKSKTSNDYTVRFDTIDASERRLLTELLYRLKQDSKW
jgi:hypothetical protein